MKIKKIIGRTDILDFPALGFENIKVKIDTGAYTSAIRCNYIKEFEVAGVKYIEFSLLDSHYPDYYKQLFITKDYTKVVVKNSFGIAEERYSFKTSVKLFNKKYKISFTLSERKDLRNPILIGRKFITNKFMVDVTQKDLSYNTKLNNENSSTIKKRKIVFNTTFVRSRKEKRTRNVGC